MNLLKYLEFLVMIGLVLVLGAATYEEQGAGSEDQRGKKQRSEDRSQSYELTAMS